MALQQDKLFITKTAFDTYRDVSEHMDDARMNASILEAQVVDVIDAVSAPIYSLMQISQHQTLGLHSALTTYSTA